MPSYFVLYLLCKQIYCNKLLQGFWVYLWRTHPAAIICCTLPMILSFACWIAWACNQHHQLPPISRWSTHHTTPAGPASMSLHERSNRNHDFAHQHSRCKASILTAYLPGQHRKGLVEYAIRVIVAKFANFCIAQAAATDYVLNYALA